MSLLFDGYNLLHATAIFGSAEGPPTLERSRVALLDFLVRAIPAKQLPRATVVFDAVGAPPGLPREMTHRGLSVRFARRGGTADELLEELISVETDPRNLLVVSSDHRVQRAARQRGAQYLDSEIWYAELERSQKTPPPNIALSDKPQFPVENPFPPGYASDLFDDG